MQKKQHPKIKFIHADICDYTFDKKYDGIISKDTLFHLPDHDLKEILVKCRRILKPNGKFCVIMDIPKESGEHIFVEELDSRYKIYYNYLTSQKCESLLKQAGFSIKEMKVLQENNEASSYASGLMVFSATNNQEVER